MKTHFEGFEEEEAYHECLRAVEGGTISPGGAGILLGMSRQRIHVLMSEGTLRAWRWYERPDSKPEIEVSVRDLVTHGVKTGRLRTLEDCGYRAEIVRVELERSLEGLTNRNPVR